MSEQTKCVFCPDPQASLLSFASEQQRAWCITHKKYDGQCPDDINHPKHYNNSQAKCECGHRIECIDVVRHLEFNIGNAIKYLWRYADKDNPVQDLKKAAWYIQDQIKKLEGSI